MVLESKTQKGAVLYLVKDFLTEYNPSSLSKKIGVTRVGAFKALKELERGGVVKGKIMGRAYFYKVDLTSPYNMKNVEVLLMEEARAHERWADEFKELSENCIITVLFGSILKDEEKARDIDILLVFDLEKNMEINKIIDEKNKILTQRIHPVKQTRKDLIKNIRKKDKVILNAIKTGIVLHGADKLLEVIKDVASPE